MSKRQGFLLFELILVCVLLVIAVCFGYYYILQADRLFLRRECEGLALVISALSQKARVEGQQKALYFDIARRSYRWEAGLVFLTEGVEFGAVAQALGPPSAPLSPVTRFVTFAHDTILFYDDGKVQAGAVYLTDTKRRWSYALSCGVGQVPYVRCYEYQGGQWVLIS